MNNRRSRARARAVQAIYQWQMTGQDAATICGQFLTGPYMRGTDEEYFETLVRGVICQRATLDDIISPYLDRALSQVDPVERAILRLGTYELLAFPAVPYRVVIDESVELAKSFGGEAGHRYVNGVLDKVARKLRRNGADVIRGEGEC